VNFKKQGKLVLRFLFGGGVGGGVHMLIFFGLDTFIPWYIFSNTIGFLIGSSINFFIQKHYTFRNKENETKKQFFKYIFVKSIVWAIDSLLLFVCISLLLLEKVLSRIIATAIITIISFYLTKVIFKNPEE